MDDRELNPLSKEHSTSSYDNHMMFYSGHMARLQVKFCQDDAVNVIRMVMEWAALFEIWGMMES